MECSSVTQTKKPILVAKIILGGVVTYGKDMCQQNHFSIHR